MFGPNTCTVTLLNGTVDVRSQWRKRHLSDKHSLFPEPDEKPADISLSRYYRANCSWSNLRVKHHDQRSSGDSSCHYATLAVLETRSLATTLQLHRIAHISAEVESWLSWTLLRSISSSQPWISGIQCSRVQANGTAVHLTNPTVLSERYAQLDLLRETSALKCLHTVPSDYTGFDRNFN